MVGSIPALVLFAPLKHGEVDHPAKRHGVFVRQLKAVAEEQAQPAQSFIRHGFAVCNEEDQVPFFNPRLGL